MERNNPWTAGFRCAAICSRVTEKGGRGGGEARPAAAPDAAVKLGEEEEREEEAESEEEDDDKEVVAAVADAEEAWNGEERRTPGTEFTPLSPANEGINFS